MKKVLLKQGCVLMVSLSLVGLGAPAVSYARIVDTQTVVRSVERDANLETVRAGLNRAEVRERFESLGVDPSKVEARLGSLTDAELDRVAKQMDELPAGGSALAVIGIVFVVLIILEVVGVIDIFKKR